MLFGIEAGLSLVLLLVAIRFPALGAAAFSRLERAFEQIASRPHLTVVVVGTLALAARVAVLPIAPVPEPSVNDEFSHLLLADTLVHGRVANPVHPMWMHFETFHEIVRPSYASMYPPAQGLFLAIGQALTQEPFVGVCLSVAILCAAICWMLQGWLSPPWALVGGLIAVARFGVFNYWANSYWGGAAAGIGGALALGALIRIVRAGRTRHAVLLGLGIALLANSRPYEGFILSLLIAVAFAIWLFTQTRTDFRASVRRVVLPLALVLAVSAGATTYYNWRITGHPLRMPQTVNRSTYAVAPYFLWQSPRPVPAYNHPEMRDFYLGIELEFYNDYRTPAGIMALVVVKIIGLWCFYIGPALMLPILIAIATIPVGVRWRDFSLEPRFLVWAATVSMAALAIEVFFLPHYAAPMTSLILAIVVISLRRVRAWQWKERPAGLFLARTIPVLCGVMVLLRAAAGPLHIPLTPDWPATWYNLPAIRTERARVIEELNAAGGQHLVFVRYRPRVRYDYDWVYNDADIDRANIVWARDMDAARNAELIQYYPGRRAWLVEPDEPRARLSPYRDPASEALK